MSLKQCLCLLGNINVGDDRLLGYHLIWGAMKAYGWAELELGLITEEWQDSEAGALRVLVRK